MTPEPRIQILPREVAERIAAGEVVERPASVVKELVENALDAGASRIVVETEAGGKALIRVTDDGCGMTPEEARLALQRHATSKLRTAEDLFRIRTLGFRGEALPSIAAVSELELLTRPREAAEGVRLRVEGGVLRSEQPAAAPVGTAVTVRRLFYNVPAREKFLRSDVAEAGQITEWLQRLALSRPDVSFRLVHDGREALLSPGSREPLNAVVAVLGRGVARELLRVEAETPAARVHGFVGRPTLARANRALQHFYVNGRAVRAPLLFRAVDDAFRSTMPQRRYPAALLFLEVPPERVDVNVHPAKIEVRFQEEEAIYGAVLRAVQAALRAAPEALTAADLPLGAPERHVGGALRVSEPAAGGGSAVAADPPEPWTPDAGPLPFAERAIGGPGAPSPVRRPDLRRPPLPARSDPAAFTPGRSAPVAHGAPGDPSASADPFVEATPPAPSTVPTTPPQALEEPVAAPRPAVGDLRLLGQMQELFILAEGGGRLWIIDQHVAHERILFDRLTAPHPEGESAREPAELLLLPVVLDVTAAEALALEEHRQQLATLGFRIEAFGPGRYALRSVPRRLVGGAVETVFRDLIDELTERSHGGRARLGREEVALAAAGRACKRAVKAGQALSRAEMERLLADLKEARHPYTCPHGRPVFLTLEAAEIAALFGRRQCDDSAPDEPV